MALLFFYPILIMKFSRGFSGTSPYKIRLLVPSMSMSSRRLSNLNRRLSINNDITVLLVTISIEKLKPSNFISKFRTRHLHILGNNGFLK